MNLETYSQAGIVPVPQRYNFDASHPFPYPEDNNNVFEEWYYKHFSIKDQRPARIYLPIFWTGYYIQARYTKDTTRMNELQLYLNSLDKKKKYYTICQYDDGIVNNLSHLDIKVFSMSGKPMDYPLPLICPEHRYKFTRREIYLANFVGKPTHPLREKMLQLLQGKEVRKGLWYISTGRHSLADYCGIISSSLFTLCPRGYGPTSFRLMESLQYGSIPVYISDQHIEPHNQDLNEYCLVVSPEQLPNLESIIYEVGADRIKAMQEKGKEVFYKYYTYDKNKSLILQNL
jgi:hypothetical protein